jgi:hypothetical protein
LLPDVNSGFKRAVMDGKAACLDFLTRSTARQMSERLGNAAISCKNQLLHMGGKPGLHPKTGRVIPEKVEKAGLQEGDEGTWEGETASLNLSPRTLSCLRG